MTSDNHAHIRADSINHCPRISIGQRFIPKYESKIKVTPTITVKMLTKSIKYYKRKFKNSIEPLLVMLINRKKEMNPNEWRNFVGQTKTTIIQNPPDFLGGNLPEQKLIAEVIQLIFSDFLNETNRQSAFLEKFEKIQSLNRRNS